MEKRPSRHGVVRTTACADHRRTYHATTARSSALWSVQRKAFGSTALLGSRATTHRSATGGIPAWYHTAAAVATSMTRSLCPYHRP